VYIRLLLLEGIFTFALPGRPIIESCQKELTLASRRARIRALPKSS
jgi:hypothetical protein